MLRETNTRGVCVCSVGGCVLCVLYALCAVLRAVCEGCGMCVVGVRAFCVCVHAHWVGRGCSG